MSEMTVEVQSGENRMLIDYCVTAGAGFRALDFSGRVFQNPA